MNRVDVIWESIAWPGIEHLWFEENDQGYSFDGLVVAALEDEPLRIRYRIELAGDWQVKQLRLKQSAGKDPTRSQPANHRGWSRVLWRAEDKSWKHNMLDDEPDLQHCTDIDISVTPLTNTLPIRRLDLQVGGSAEINVVYVAVPALTLEPAPQRYTRLENGLYRFESLGSDFVADISVDKLGLVANYPGLFQRVWPKRAG